MNFSDKFYKDFGLSPVPKEYLNKQELYNLFKKPAKETKADMPRFYNFEENDTHQADILFLPDDNGYKYALVVTDIATAKTDAEPLKNKNASYVLNAIKNIYKRGILKKPNHLIVDSGTEFQKEFSSYFHDNSITLKKALPGRHRQIALVERKNQILGRVLFMRMFAQELLTGDISKEWIEDLPLIIEKMNLKYSHKPYTDEELHEKFNPWENLTQHILPLGTNVRVALDEPRDIQERKLIGKFRDTDHRWTTEIYKITSYVFDPHQPLLYKVNKPLKKNERVAYTRKQIQVVGHDEEDPNPIVIKGVPKQYVIKQLLKRRTRKGKTEYLVQWKGYKNAEENTWEDSKNIPMHLIEAFNQQ